jgi:hypothetical protein
VVAATALQLERPVALLTNDPAEMSRLVEKPERPSSTCDHRSDRALGSDCEYRTLRIRALHQ